MSKKVDLAPDTWPEPPLAKLSAYFRKLAQESQNHSDHVPESKHAPDTIASVTPAVSGSRLNRLTKATISELIDLHDDIAKWYLLEFFRQTGGSERGGDELQQQAEMLNDRESNYGLDFLRSYTQKPITGDIRTAFEPNFWFLQGKIHMLRWLLGRRLTETNVDICWIDYLPLNFDDFEKLSPEESASDDSEG